jgi:hypothetical protein
MTRPDPYLLTTLTLLTLLTACGSESSSPLPRATATAVNSTTSEGSTVPRTTPTALEKSIDSYISTKAKTLAKPVIEALASYQQAHQSYPKTLAELDSKRVTSFDITDYPEAGQPEASKFTHDRAGNVTLYTLDYKLTESGYQLICNYSVLDLVQLAFSSETGEWRESRIF